MLRRTPLFLLLLAALLVAAPRAGGAEVKTYTIEHQDRERTYHLVIPKDHDKKKAVPLVIALHGGGGTGKGYDRSANRQFTREADRRGWVVVFPDGVAKGWNDGRKLVSWRDRRRAGVDDVGFIGKLIDRLQKTMGIDTTRVYATGISNGGFMSIRLGLELSEKIAAIAPVTANLQKVHGSRQPAHPVGLMVINGTKDPLVPYDGGYVQVFGRKRGAIFSTDETIKRWTGFNKCTGKPKVSRLPDKDPKDGTVTVASSWTGCKGGAEVLLYRVEGGGHTWPGGAQYLSRRLIGPVSRDFDAVPAIFDFFARHRRVPRATTSR